MKEIDAVERSRIVVMPAERGWIARFVERRIGFQTHSFCQLLELAEELSEPAVFGAQPVRAAEERNALARLWSERGRPLASFWDGAAELRFVVDRIDLGEMPPLLDLSDPQL